MRVLERRLQPSQTESGWSISTGEEVTLMDWGNAIVKEIKTENGMITQLIGELHLEGSVKSTKLKLTWLPDIEDLVSLSLVEFDYLINKKKVRQDEKRMFLMPLICYYSFNCA
jgi:hypothetical protein